MASTKGKMGSNVIRVKLVKQKKYGLGFLVRHRSKSPYVVVSDLVSGGMAAESGLVQIGDVILKVNDVSFEELTYEKSLEALKALPVNTPVVLILRGPEGYISHLETRFSEDGVPRTIRVTKPVVHTDGIFDKIKKSFTNSGSPKPVRTRQTQANMESSQGSSNNRKSAPNGDIPSSVDHTEIDQLNDTDSNRNHKPGNKGSSSNNSQTIGQNGTTGKVATRQSNAVNNAADTTTADSNGVTMVHKNGVDSSNGSAPNGDVNGSPAKVNGARKGLDVDNKVAKSSPTKKFVKVKHIGDERPMTTDTLHQKVLEDLTCSGDHCMGSIMYQGLVGDKPRPKPETMKQARQFIDEYYQSIKRLNSPAHITRRDEVMRLIEDTGTYEISYAELTYGAKTAWRNAPRCIGRIQWSKLQVFDARHITTARGMFEAICNHIKYGTNKGNLRSAITVFPPRTDGKHDFKLWNPQLIRYAGYQQADGKVIGDPSNVELTEVCQKMGWKGKGTRFDVLPLILQANGHDPECFEIPTELVLEVNLKHPKFPWFAEMGLRWYALPAVANMVFDCGGLLFPASPFNGWYMGTEVGARDLCDKFRYNLLEEIAQKMGFDTRKSSTLWKDRTLVEINVAVLHSYQSQGVTIWDHHVASESFMKHLDNEQKLRGGCPADWVWVVPPMSGSITPVFHQEMLLYKLKPSFEYQEADWVWVVPPMSGSITPVFHQEMLLYKLKPSFEYQADPWKTHVWKKDKERTKSISDKPRRKIGFRELARAVKFSAKLMGKALARRVKCVILFGSETGKSEGFAQTLCQTFKHAFDAKVLCMDEYDVSTLEHETLVLIVTSTFGNGDPPENGEGFAKSLFEMKHPESRDNLMKRKSVQLELIPLGGNTNRLARSKDNLPESEHESRLSKQTSYMRLNSMASIDREDIDTIQEKGGHSGGVDENMAMETGPLSNVRYSCFALGSSAYPNYCAFGHYLDNMFNELGAERIHKVVDGDELCGQEESFRFWAKDVFKAACDTFCVGDESVLHDATGTLNKADNTWTADTFRITPASGQRELDISQALSAIHNKDVIGAKFTERTQLQSSDSDRQTILVKMDTTIGQGRLLYSPGDHVAVFPENSQKVVDAILIRLHNAPPPDQLIKVEALNERSTPLGSMKSWDAVPRLPPCTLRTAFSRFLDVTTPPSQTLLKLLAHQASKDCDRESLENLANDSHLYEEWKYETYPNIVVVLDQFPSLRVPPSLLLSQLPLLQSRFYSISSSLKFSPGEIHATVAVVRYRTQGENGPLHEGVCSTYLNRIEDGVTIPCIVRHAPAFHMPADMTLPMILVGPGTGIAPFRSFWLQRKIDMEMQPEPQSSQRKGWGNIYLYFGCRNSTMDDIYKDELAQMKREGVLKDVYTALSREPNQPKMYVQTILKKNAVDVFDCIVRKNGHFYVCGDVKMASDVTATLEKILCQEGNMTPQDAKNFVLKLRDNNRFHEDIFGVTLRSSEVTDRARDQAKRAWNFINSVGSKSRGVLDKETVTPIPTGESKAPKGKPKAPHKTLYTETIKE